MCQENDKSAPETLYHYCSPVGFERIITSRRIWLSNIFYMNDNLEHHWFRQKALRFIEASQLPQISIEDKVDIFELLSQDRPDDIFCLCLSEESDLLSQWRAYSDDGTGFAIGFNTNYFRYYTCRGHVGKAHVIYDDAAQERMLQGIFGRHNYEIGVGTTPLDAQRLIQILWNEAARCKNPAFSEEKEWRIIFRCHVPENSTEHKLKSPFAGNDDLCEIGFHVRQGVIVPHVAMRLDNPDTVKYGQAISSVLMGPKNRAPGQERAVRQMLAANGFLNVEIRQSKASYR